MLDALVRVLGESHFLWEDYLHAQPENVLPMICDPAQWTRPPGRQQLAADLDEAAGPGELGRGRGRGRSAGSAIARSSAPICGRSSG